MTRPLSTVDYRNLEDYSAFNFSRPQARLNAGVSAMIRVKNEASKIARCLHSIYSLFDEIVVVDNNSDDNTLDIVENLIRDLDSERKVRVLGYPFHVARCGDDHNATAENSVHSLAYYYNWCLAQCRCPYVCKWDADMVAKRKTVGAVRHFLRTFNLDQKMAGAIPIQTLYRTIQGKLYLAKGEIYSEVRVFPNRADVYFEKANLFESLKLDSLAQRTTFSKVGGYELKYTDEAEFSHWTAPIFSSKRKLREWQSFNEIKQNKISTEKFESLGVEADFFVS